MPRRRTIREELAHLRKLKREAEEVGRKKKDADSQFKSHQRVCLDRMEAEEIDSLKSGGTLFSRVEKVKGYVEDRQVFVRWALEQDEGISEFLAAVDLEPDMVEEFYEAIMNTELVTYKEKGDLLNEMARAAADDVKPMPPGTNWRPDDYISQRTA